MLALTPPAAAQLERLERFYSDRQRPAAVHNLIRALEEASYLIATAADDGRAAPRPYPELARLGLRWVKCRRYWIAYDPAAQVIAGVFFETSDIPNRIA